MKNKRLILQMISALLITGGIVGTSIGIYTAHNNMDYVKNDVIDEEMEKAYSGAIATTVVSVGAAEVGIGLYPFRKRKIDDEQEHQSQEDDYGTKR